MSFSPTPVPESRSAPALPPPARRGKPVVVALIGLPGAGKSVVARALADQLDYRRIDRDLIRHAMFPRCSYSFVEKRASFRALLLALEVNCMLGESSVLDGCTFSRRADLARVDQVVRQHGYTAVPIFLDCPSPLARERIARDMAGNRHLARDRTPDVVGEVLARMEPPPPGALSIDARLPAAEVCRLAVDAVARIAGIERD
ncbi:AAA family ATPase [Tahibacter harae]|uniref:ATP-binding protein n=1 Tax=Tahibacter harae TaxID=2963937 RepID=A0ABT1QSM6_9GAMM|nr:ATP-binding protein [Tahibacter harae]MCQ4165307.1 ATP-binding protein [Tahibacter harae]